MQILRTLGRYANNQYGIFGYKRTSQEVFVTGPLHVENRGADEYHISNEDWNAMLEHIEQAQRGTFRLRPANGGPVAQSLEGVVGNHIDGNNPSLVAYIASILVHEGCLELYHGPLGPNDSVFIALRKDI